MRQPAYLGMTLFLAAESVFFFMLLLAFVYFREASRVSANLNLREAAIATACLLGGCGAMWRSAAARVTSETRIWIGAAAVLGLVFLFTQWREYGVLLRSGITISQSLFGTTFFTLSGMHFLHVTAGIVVLALLAAIAPGNPTAVHAAAMFWYFLGAVWLAIFAVVYLRIPA